MGNFRTRNHPVDTEDHTLRCNFQYTIKKKIRHIRSLILQKKSTNTPATQQLTHTQFADTKYYNSALILNLILPLHNWVVITQKGQRKTIAYPLIAHPLTTTSFQCWSAPVCEVVAGWLPKGTSKGPRFLRPLVLALGGVALTLGLPGPRRWCANGLWCPSMTSDSLEWKPEKTTDWIGLNA